MGRTIADANGGGDFAPTALLKEKDAMLKGVLKSKREIKTMYGPKLVYSFTVLDATCRFTKDKQEVSPEEGQVVDVIPPTRLARQLAQVQEGETVTMTYAGTKKVGKGQPAHCFKVTVE
jgi:hypothetical protein